jgi:hypothetical protein
MRDERDSAEEPGAAPSSKREDEEPETLGDWVRPYFTDPALWPVLAVGAIALFSLGGALLVFAVAERRLPAVGAMLLVLWMSVDASLRERRRGGFGALSATIAACWLGSALVGVALVGFGLF